MNKSIIEKFKKIPGWEEFCEEFSMPSDKKKQLIEMAKNGEPKPSRRFPLGEALRSYSYTGGKGYDPEFDKKMRELRPDWFVTHFDIANEKRKKILEMAKNGEPRPNTKTPLGLALRNYAKKNLSEGAFNKRIRELRPDWFESKADKAMKKKKELLKMAENGEQRPNQRKGKLGSALCTYTRKSHRSYDPDFNKKIKALRPDWFANTADINKQKLLRIAKNGEQRPNQKKSKLGSVLCAYTKESHASYDPEFRKKIRALRPDWFKRSSKAT